MRPYSAPQLHRTLLKMLTACLLAGLAVVALGAVNAHASKSQVSVIEDPARVYNSDPAVQSASLDEMQALGAKMVKIAVPWRSIAPDGTSTTKPVVDLSDPNNYPAGSWDILDRAVSGAESRGMRVWLMLTAPAPRWAEAKESSKYLGAYQPDATAYGQFAKAVGRRYTSVHQFSIWNEPNLARYMQPQVSRSVITSAISYRNMYRAAYSGLTASGHSHDKILFGELLPSYATKRAAQGTQPLLWLQEFFCLDTKGKPYKGSLAKKHSCTGFKKIHGSGLSYHPYFPTDGPLTRPTSPYNATLAYLSRVEKLLDQASKARRLSGHRVKIYSSEFGIQSDPPKPYGTSMRKIPYFLNMSEYLTWVDSRVATYSQYLLVDDADLNGFQTGLRFADGSKKEAVYAAYQTPMMVFKDARSRSVTVWGCLRAKPAGSTTAEIQVQSGGSWTTVKSVNVTSAAGYFKTTVSAPGASSKTYRIRWSGGTSRTSKPGALVKPRR